MPSRRRLLATLGGAGVAGVVGYHLLQDDLHPLDHYGTFHRATDWPTFNHDSANSGAISAAPRSRQGGRPTVAWRGPVDTVSNRSRVGYPVVRGDLVVYPDGGVLRAFDATTGEQRWSVPVVAESDGESSGAPRISAPTVTDEHVVVGATGSPNALRGYDLRGDLAWETPTPAGGRITGAPAYDHETAALYVGTTRERLLRVDAATGAVEWVRRVFGAVDVPVAAAHGYIYAVSRTDGAAFAVDAADGRGQWHTDLDRELVAPPTIVGYVYLLDEHGTLFALDLASGEVEWRTDLPPIGWTIPIGITVGARYVYLSYVTHSATGRLYAVHAHDGSRAWTLRLDNILPSTIPVVVGTWGTGSGQEDESTVYLPTGDAVIALRAEAGLLTRRERWRWAPDDTSVRGLVAADGRLVVPIERERDGQQPRAELVALE